MAEMGEEDLQRPIRFSPAWPPRHEERSMPRNVPGCSMVFRKSNWPPPSADDAVDASVSGESGPNASSNPSNSTSDSSQGEAGSAQYNASNEVVNKPKRAVRDYSSFFGKNAAPPSRPVYVLTPGAIAVPEAFSGSGNPEESE